MSEALNYTDDEIRDLVLLRLESLSSDSIKTIGNRGTFNKQELIENVTDGSDIGKLIQEMELEWLRAQNDGILDEILGA